MATFQVYNQLANLTAHGVVIGEGSNPPNGVVLTAGQVLIGTTASDPVGATLTAGTGISISSTSGSITITATGGAGESWTSVTSNTALVKSNGYFAASSSQITFTLPSTTSVGDTFEVAAPAAGTGGWIIAQNSGQQIQLGNLTTTSGATGKLTAHNGAGDWVEIVCTIANTNFVACVKQGSVDVT